MSASIFQILEGSPQVLFPQGLQEDFLVTNTGITSVYLDMDSSINKSSYRLRPLSSMVWSGGKPLWAVADKPPSYRGATYLNNIESISSAQITVNRNNQNATASTSAYTQPIASIPAFTGSGANLIRFDNLEVGHLETIVLSFRVPNLPWSNTKIIITDALWYEDSQDTTTNDPSLSVQRVQSWYPDGGVYSTYQLTLPVRGPRLQLDVQAEDGVIAPITNIRLFGRSGVGKTQVSNLWTNAIAYSPTLGIPLTADDDTITWNGNYDFAPIYTQAKSSLLKVSLRTHAAVTVAGTLVLMSQGGWFDRIDIPVGPANTMITADLNVPLTARLNLNATTVPTPAPSGSNYTLSLLYKDGATL